MITKLYVSVDITQDLFNSLITKCDLDVAVHAEQIIWNRSPARFFKEYMKTNQQILFGTYLNKPLTRR